MNDVIYPTPVVKLLQIILNQFHKENNIFNIPGELFFKPAATDAFRLHRYGQLLENPLGVAAGPHTQLAQNIVAAWLCGARYIELKTVQTLDHLEISRPCIDMRDEGYNCEWSQELTVQQAFDQYLDAWIIIHVLKHMLEGGKFSEPGFIFNMSIGYNLEGIKKQNVQWFLAKMQDASVEIKERASHLKFIYPEIDEITINPCISNNITLSTMHGCSPGEIEKIGNYLLTDKKLHTTIKLNPTLLGKEKVLTIISQSGYDIEIPDQAFEHDLKYSEAIKIITNLQKTARKENLHFGVKLSNTLECFNNKDYIPGKEKMVYLSGTPLHPLAINLAEKLQNDFHGSLDISFSAGLDAFNFTDVVACGLYPATMCSDILKPGGYARMAQYIQNLRQSFSELRANSLEGFILQKDKKNLKDYKEAILHNLWKYALKINSSQNFQKKHIKDKSIKTTRQLGLFDCIYAPCETTCPTNQAIADYMYYAATDQFDQAKQIILQTNPFPETTGMVCDNTCQHKCTRMNYDSSLLIRDIKHTISRNSQKKPSDFDRLPENQKKVAIIGAGPSGLSCACYLALAGFKVTIYEKNDKPGGMVATSIPNFRIDQKSMEADIDAILSLGVKIHYNQTVDKVKFNTILAENDYAYIAVGASKPRQLPILGYDPKIVIDPIEFLVKTKKGQINGIGKHYLVIGGGNTAIDAARTAQRITGRNGSVKLVYRRTIRQMPANEDEIKALLADNIEIYELTNPVRISKRDNGDYALVCQKMKLGKLDQSGRAIPLTIEGSEFEIRFNTIIPALGMEKNIDFVTQDLLKTEIGNLETQIPDVFIGGDAHNGGASAIAAIGDGRKTAQFIIDREGINYNTNARSKRPKTNYRILMAARAKRVESGVQKKNTIEGKPLFPLLSKQEAMAEASRCLLCDELCNICTTVCPNMALFAYHIRPFAANGFEIKQNTQIIHIADWCNLCGNCETFCPTSGAPFMKKPHLYLNKEAFGKADEGYYFIYTHDEQTLLYKKGDDIHSFAENPLNYSYVTKSFTMQIKKRTFEVLEVIQRNPLHKPEISKAIEMSVLLEGARQFFGLQNH
jgi:putative selenate reductase